MRGTERRGYSLESVLLAAMCAGYVGWVLSLPMFPTQDGPVHLYYAHVMRALFRAGPSVYKRFYTIKHLLPPYSAYYYLLIALSRVVPLFLADKLVICGYIVSFTYGFRYLARAVGPSAEQASLLATVLLLNWPLGMGFVNFCLGVSLALWTLGVWMRAVGLAGNGRRALFVGLCIVLALVHPVPLLAVLGYCVIDVAVRALWRRPETDVEQPRLRRADLACLGLALLTLGYVKLFTIAHATQQMLPSVYSPVGQVVHNCVIYARGQGLSFFSQFLRDASAPKRAYRLLLIAIVPFGLTMAAWQAIKDRRTGVRPGRMWLWLTVAMIAVQPFVPHDINASHFFADRLLLFLWVGALLAMSGAAVPGLAGRTVIALAAVVGMGIIVGVADAPVRAIARDMVHVEALPAEHSGELGIALGDTSAQPEVHTGLTFNPYLWGELNYFRHNDAVLYNTPWMDLTVIPLGARDGLATGVFSPNALEDAQVMREALSDPKMRAKAMMGLQFAVENHFERPGTMESDALLPGWRCSERSAWYAVCTP